MLHQLLEPSAASKGCQVAPVGAKHASMSDVQLMYVALHTRMWWRWLGCLVRQIVSPESMVGYMEQAKGSTITRVFEDAYKSPLSIVILVCACCLPLSAAPHALL